MARKPIPDFLEILKVLTDHKVDFIVVGGICAVLHGAPLTTFDLDLVHSRSPDNLDRLISALKELDAHYRGRGDERLTPEVAHLSSPGHQLLMTKFGPLDLLGTIGMGHTYNDLLKHSVELEVSTMRLCALDLETLIEVKKETISEKDKIANISVSARIMREFEARWIDKFIQIIHRHKDRIGTRSLSENIMDYLRELEATAVKIDFTYPYFVEKSTPVSKETCLV